MDQHGHILWPFARAEDYLKVMTSQRARSEVPVPAAPQHSPSPVPQNGQPPPAWDLRAASENLNTFSQPPQSNYFYSIPRDEHKAGRAAASPPHPDRPQISGSLAGKAHHFPPRRHDPGGYVLQNGQWVPAGQWYPPSQVQTTPTLGSTTTPGTSPSTSQSSNIGGAPETTSAARPSSNVPGIVEPLPQARFFSNMPQTGPTRLGLIEQRNGTEATAAKGSGVVQNQNHLPTNEVKRSSEGTSSAPAMKTTEVASMIEEHGPGRENPSRRQDSATPHQDGLHVGQSSIDKTMSETNRTGSTTSEQKDTQATEIGTDAKAGEHESEIITIQQSQSPNPGDVGQEVEIINLEANSDNAGAESATDVDAIMVNDAGTGALGDAGPAMAPAETKRAPNTLEASTTVSRLGPIVIESSADDTVSEEGLSTSEEETGPTQMREPSAEEEFKDSASTLVDPSISQGSPRESSALDDFLASRPIKSEPDVDEATAPNRKDSANDYSFLLGDETDDDEEDQGVPHGLGSQSVESDRVLPLRLQMQVSQWIKRHGAGKKPPPFATSKQVDWDGCKFTDMSGNNLEKYRYPSHTPNFVYFVVRGPTQQPIFVRFVQPKGRVKAKPGTTLYSAWLGEEGFEKEPSIIKIKEAEVQAIDSEGKPINARISDRVLKRKREDENQNGYDSADSADSLGGGIIPSGRSLRTSGMGAVDLESPSPEARSRLPKLSAMPRQYEREEDLPRYLQIMMADYFEAYPGEDVPEFAQQQMPGNQSKLPTRHVDIGGNPITMSFVPLNRGRHIIRVAEGPAMPAAIVKYGQSGKRSGAMSSFFRWLGGKLWESEASVFKLSTHGQSKQPQQSPRAIPPATHKSNLGFTSLQSVLPPKYSRFEEIPRHLQQMVNDFFRSNPSVTKPEFCNTFVAEKRPTQSKVRHEDIHGGLIQMSLVTIHRPKKFALRIAEGSSMSACIVKFDSAKGYGSQAQRSTYFKWLGGHLWETEPSVFKVYMDSKGNWPPPLQQATSTPSRNMSKPASKIRRVESTASMSGRLGKSRVTATPPVTRLKSTPQKGAVTTSSSDILSDALAERTTFAFYLQTAHGSTMRNRSFFDCDTIQKLFEQATKVHRFSNSGGEVEAVSCKIAQLSDEPEQMLFKDDEEDYLSLLERVLTYLKGQKQQQGCVVEVRVLGT